MDAQSLESIYTEVILFVAVFVSMYVVSFFISRRNAKQFKIDNPIEIRRENIQKEIDQIIEQIDFTANNTEFNEQKILNYAQVDPSVMSNFPGISQATLDDLTTTMQDLKKKLK